MIMSNVANAMTGQHHCLKWCTSGTAFASFFIITIDFHVPKYERTAVIMSNLANAITDHHHCLKLCTSRTAFARFYIITADVPMYGRTAVIM